MEVFSTTANAFSVVGLADIVIKYGVGLYETLSKIKQAPQETKELLAEIKDVGEVVAQVRIFGDAYEQSDYPGKDKLILERVRALLNRCEQELLLLQKHAADTVSAQTDNWLLRYTKNATWVWSKQEIAQSSRRLQRLRKELDTTLLLAGRENDITIHAEVKATHTDVVNSGAAIESCISTLQTQVNSATKSAADKFASAQKEAEIFAHQTKTDLNIVTAATAQVQKTVEAETDEVKRDIRAATSTAVTQYASLNHSISRNAVIVNKNIKNASKAMTKPHIRQSRQQILNTSKILAKIDDTESTIVKHVSSIRFTRNSEQTFRFYGENIESLTLPLSLMHSGLLKALPGLMSKPEMQISRAEATWIQQQIEAIMARSYDFSAASARQKETHCRYTGDILLGTSQPLMGEPYEISRVTKSYEARKYRVIPTQCGLILMKVTDTSEAKTVSSFEAQSLTFELSFLPNNSLPVPALSVALAKITGQLASQPTVLPSVRVWNMRNFGSEVFQVVHDNDVEALRSLFEQRLASPFDRSPTGNSLVYYACMSCAADVFEFLIHQAVGLLDDTNEEDKILRESFHGGHNKEPWGPVCRILRLAHANGWGSGSEEGKVDCLLWVLSNFMIHYEISQETFELFDILSSFAQGFHVPFESRAFLSLASWLWPYTNLHQFFTTMVVDANVVDNHNRGALHYTLEAMVSRNTSKCSLEGYKQLRFLIELGCCPHLEDEDGFTPTDYARMDKGIFAMWWHAVVDSGHLPCEVFGGDSISLEETAEEFDQLPGLGIGYSYEIQDDFLGNSWFELYEPLALAGSILMRRFWHCDLDTWGDGFDLYEVLSTDLLARTGCSRTWSYLVGMTRSCLILVTWMTLVSWEAWSCLFWMMLIDRCSEIVSCILLLSQ
ncbi:uncharacterized protein K452DRAFT_361026, partial [Aplosporella prunicola CBS 121167]